MSTECLTMRAADATDLPGVLSLYAQPEMDDGRVLSIDDAEAIFERFAIYPDYTLYVTENDRKIVGTFALLVMDNLGHCGAPSAIVENVMVDPAAQGLGIGKAMMAFAIEQARARGCYKLTLSSNTKRATAHAFYEALGFERHGYSFRVLLEDAPQ